MTISEVEFCQISISVEGDSDVILRIRENCLEEFERSDTLKCSWLEMEHFVRGWDFDTRLFPSVFCRLNNELQGRSPYEKCPRDWDTSLKHFLAILSKKRRHDIFAKLGLIHLVKFKTRRKW